MAKENEKKARDYILKNLRKELIGPGSEGVDGLSIEEERISESPLQRYSLGILYPQKLITGEDIDITNDIIVESDEVPSENEEEQEEEEVNNNVHAELDTMLEDDFSINAANQYCPSTIGMSFIVDKQINEILLEIKAAKYVALKNENDNNIKARNEFIKITEDLSFLRELNLNVFKIEGDNLFFNQNYNVLQDGETINSLEPTQTKLFWMVYNKSKSLHFGKIFTRCPIKNIREPINLNDLINNKSHKFNTSENGLKLTVKKREVNNNLKVTVTVLNENSVVENEDKFSSPELAYFQSEMIVSLPKSEYSFKEFEKIHIGHSAEKIDQLLYRNKKIFAVGHGCSVIWNGQSPRELKTDFMPAYEVPQTSFSIGNNDLKCIDVKYLANPNTEKMEMIGQLKQFVKLYKNWIIETANEIPVLPEHLREQAAQNMDYCSEASNRIEMGIKLLEEDDTILTCFRFMNKAMMMQRYHTDKYVRNPRSVNDPNFNAPPVNYFESILDSSFNWRPFQLAFILLSIESIVNPQSDYRKVADLIWFPTGGGKTEAYLGVIAFTIFYRRIITANEQFQTSGGTAVLMRYTLRLLTAQQYQRASTLICACELIRRLHSDLFGNEKITIGLWVGAANTPNNCDEAVRIVNQHLCNQIKIEDENPFQVLSCPWCGTKLVDENDSNKLGFQNAKVIDGVDYRFYLRCINDGCSFNNYLPLQVVDQEIYNKPTTLLLATADKFAMLAHKPETRFLFGFPNGNKTPELIIQDELHLISGPFGSLFGIYETIIDYLCLHNQVPPKIISSTATIKKAGQQISALFDRDSRLFPPPGLITEDSFFAKELPIDNINHGRLYVGLMSIGMTQTTGQVRALSNLLYYNLKCSSENNNINGEQRIELIDKYYTIVGYYNTIRELGNACSLIQDDISARFKQLKTRKRENYWRPIWYSELTSRVEAKEIPKILKSLENNKYVGNDKSYSEKPIPLILSTNMFSVGVDISRLNLMFVCGQPKTNAEYIQSSSRVGRSDPGMVIVLFDGYRPRDRSHYENFQSFHQSFYRFVEPTSVTPFSLPSRRRALHTLLIILTRLSNNLEVCSKFESGIISQTFWNYFENRIGNSKNITEIEKETIITELHNRIDEWVDWIQKNSNNINRLVFSRSFLPPNAGAPQRAAVKAQIPLFSNFGMNDGLWKVLNSLRNVDIPTYCIMKEK